jgi:hypothetical protein
LRVVLIMLLVIATTLSPAAAQSSMLHVTDAADVVDCSRSAEHPHDDSEDGTAVDRAGQAGRGGDNHPCQDPRDCHLALCATAGILPKIWNLINPESEGPAAEPRASAHGRIVAPLLDPPRSTL